MKFLIDELEIIFPYETIYPEQYFYMKRLKETLDKSGHCILEMPSGTGKTVSLLSLTLAYLLKYPNKIEKIVYCSRTVPEMDKSLGELKTLVDYYKENSQNMEFDISAIILTARKNLCINKEVLAERDGNDIDSLCYSRTAPFARKNQENASCEYFENFQSRKEAFELPVGIYDIETIKSFSKKEGICPYFMARKCIKQANIIIYSYAYLLDPKISSIVSKELPQNSIIIFDEAHNIDNACIEGMSIELNISSCKKALDNLRSLKSLVQNKKNLEINSINKEYKKMVGEFSSQFKGQVADHLLSNPVLPKDLTEEAIPGNIRKAHTFLLTLSKFAEYVKLKLKVQHVVIESPSYFMKEVYKDIFLDRRTLKHLHEQLTALLQMLEISDLSLYRPIIQIASLASLLSTYSDGFALICEPYDTKTNIYDPKIYFTCLDASIAMKPVFSTFQSVIVTSGTLSPIDMYPKILDFQPAVVDSFSMSLARPCICPMVISHGNDQIALSSRFESREDASVARNYGNLIVEMSKVVPDGMICFFPSYFYMEYLINFWNESGTLEAIQKNKLIFVETPLFSETNAALRNYKKACRNGRGSVFFSIARGKVSEGVDFSHEYGRCVIMVGIPYMYTKSRILQARMEFLRENFLIRESEFLNFDALRHASQCLGRVLRSKDDYGILLLADQRYSRSDKRSKLPKWIIENLKEGFINLTTDDAVHYGKIFLRQMAQKFTKNDQIGISMLREDQLGNYLESSGWATS